LGTGALPFLSLRPIAEITASERNKVRAAYNYDDFLPERRKMMQEWGDYLVGAKLNLIS
jgi:hypothetical protein